MKIILAVVCITFIYVFTMVNLEAYHNQLNTIIPKPNIEENIPNSEVIPDKNENSSSNETKPSAPKEDKIKVTIIGEILHPGTYSLKKDATYDDLIKLGGLTQQSADESCYNLSLTLKDEMTYYIPKNTDFKVSINSSDANNLMMLKGIGKATADRIIKYRNENGEFECIDDIKNVPGIKELTFNKIRDYIKL